MTLGQRHRTAIQLVAVCLLSISCLPGATRGKSRASHRSEPPPESTSTTAGRVNDIRFWSQGDTTRIAIEVTSDYKLKSDRLQNPDRLFFDIVGVKPAGPKGIQTIAVGDALIKQIRVAETQPGTTRIVLDLASAVEFDASQLTSPKRVMIEVRSPGTAKKQPALEQRTEQKAPEKPLEKPAPPVVTAKKFFPPVLAETPLPPPSRIDATPPKLVARVDSPMIPTQRIPPPPPRETARDRAMREAQREIPSHDAMVASTATPTAAPRETAMRVSTSRTPVDAPAAPAKKTATGEASLTRVLGLKLGRVVIDAGHGGHDAGTHGPGGLMEKDLVLDVAKRLAVLVETRMGSEVLLTRSDDTFIPLEQRPRMANEARADLFISVHANSSPVRTISGVETYYLNFTTSKTALEVAARENATSENSISDLKDLLQKIALKDKVEESREFAARVQSSLAVFSAKNSGAKDRGVKKAPFVVLIGAQMPAILAEIGFVTNTRDEQMMKKPEYRQKIAEALYRGIAQYASGLSHFQMAQRKSAAGE